MDGVAAALVILGTGLTAAKDVPGPAWLHWLLIGVGGVVAILSQFTKWLRQVHEAERARHRLLRGGWPPPLVREVDPFWPGLGIFASAIAEKYVPRGEIPPYVDRDADAALHDRLTRARLALVSGTSKAGTSRTAFQALVRLARTDPTLRLLVPASPDALPQLLELDPPLDLPQGPCALWLDEADRYLAVPAVSRASLEAFIEKTRNVVVIATITLSEYARLTQEKGDIGEKRQPSERRRVAIEDGVDGMGVYASSFGEMFSPPFQG
jgi:hypothetical protein